MENKKEFLEWEIFADLEPEHDGRELHIFDSQRDKKRYDLDEAMRKVEEMFKKQSD